jgi:hypothetical protein
MTKYLSKNKFSELLVEDLQGLVLSQEIVSPVLRISRGPQSCFAELGTYAKSEAERGFLATPSLDHDWVLDGNIVRPLPEDIEALILATFENYDLEKLSLKDVIALCNAKHESPEILVDDDVWMPAAAAAVFLRLSGTSMHREHIELILAMNTR